MAQAEQVSDNEVDQVLEDRGEIENEEHTTSELSDAQSTAEFNLVVVFLSLLSSKEPEESSTLAKNEEERHRAKASIKKLQKSRREMDEAKPVKRQTTERFKTTAWPEIVRNNCIQGRMDCKAVIRKL
ncbi:hypothetical protein ACLB2K_076597 [Fragaria x ananassa]